VVRFAHFPTIFDILGRTIITPSKGNLNKKSPIKRFEEKMSFPKNRSNATVGAIGSHLHMS